MSNFAEMLKADGLRVFMRKLTDEYCFCTDGKGIAYVQWSNIRTCVSTVHKANPTTGTGFQVFDEITLENVRKAMYITAPNWASRADVQSVHKYADWNSYHSESEWNRGLTEI